MNFDDMFMFLVQVIYSGICLWFSEDIPENSANLIIYMQWQEAVKGEFWRLRDSKGKPPGVLGWWPSRAVTFIDNHDTGSTQVPDVVWFASSWL